MGKEQPEGGRRRARPNEDSFLEEVPDSLRREGKETEGAWGGGARPREERGWWYWGPGQWM